MDTRRARTLAGSTFMLGLLVSVLVSPVAAAECALSAPATVKVGTPLAINGSSFPASSTIDVALTIEGGTPDVFTVTSNAAGAFQISLTPEAADVGKTTVVTTAGSTCSAQVIYTVTSSAPVASVAPVAAATSRPVAPRTDAASLPGDRSSGERLDAWLLAVVVVVIGTFGLVATRPRRSR